MKCSQCATPALYMMETHPLCLACWARVQDIQFRQFLENAAMINQSTDDMEAVVGFSISHKRIPVEALARAVSMNRTYNNIRIANSSIGVINTGDLARIDAAVTITQGTEAAEFGARLKDLIELIARSSTLTGDQKREMVEVATVISDQVVSKSPSKTVIGALFAQLVSMSSGLTTIAAAVDTLHKAWSAISGG